MATGDRYKAVGGTVEIPHGTNGTVIRITDGQVAYRTLKLDNVTAPGDNGNVEFDEGNYVYEATLRGWYTEGDATNDTLPAVTRGTLKVQVGNGETWNGTGIIRRLEAAPAWTDGGDIPVRFQAIWSGAVTQSAPA